VSIGKDEIFLIWIKVFPEKTGRIEEKINTRQIDEIIGIKRSLSFIIELNRFNPFRT
jgi:hypothetical protein